MSSHTNLACDFSLAQITHRGRFVHFPTGWYARTREDVDLGPFFTFEEAELALRTHIAEFEPDGQKRSFNGADDADELPEIHIHDTDTCKRTNCTYCMESYAVGQLYSNQT